MIIQAKTKNLITLCANLTQAEKLVNEARLKGDKAEVVISNSLIDKIVIDDLKMKAVKDA